MPSRALGYQQYTGLVLDSSLHDGNDATNITNTGASTGYEVMNAGSGVNVSATGVLDLGLMPGTATSIRAVLKWAGAPSVLLEYNSALTAGGWTAPGGGPFLPDTFGVYTAHYLTWTIASVAARYWRISLRDTEDGNGSARAGIMEMWAYDGSATIPEGVGGTAYTDAPQVKTGGRAAVLDVTAYVTLPQVKTSALPELTGEVYAPVEFVQIKGAVAVSVADIQTVSGGGIDYADSPRVKVGGKAAAGDVQSGQDDPGARSGFFASVIDSQVHIAPIRYTEVTRVLGAAKADASGDAAALLDLPQVKIGARNHLIADSSTMTDAPQVKVGGRPAVFDSRGFTDAVQAKIGVQPSVRDRWRTADAVRVKTAGKAAVADLYALALNAQARVGGRAAIITEVAVLIETVNPQVMVGGRASVTGSMGLTESPSNRVRAGGRMLRERQAITEVCRVGVGVRLSQTDARILIEAPRVAVGVKVA